MDQHDRVGARIAPDVLVVPELVLLIGRQPASGVRSEEQEVARPIRARALGVERVACAVREPGPVNPDVAQSVPLDGGRADGEATDQRQ